MFIYRIELENDDEFHPKDVVKGKLVCIFNTFTFVGDVLIHLIGEENTTFLKIHSNPTFIHHGTRDGLRSGLQIEESKGYNKFLSMSKTLCSAEAFRPGTHELPFSFLLPENIPGTYECSIGGVKFSLKVTVDLGNDTEDCVKEIKVVAPLCNPEYAWFDSNVAAHKPYSKSTENCFSSSCLWGNRAIVMDVYLPKRAFIQGERVSVRVDITNTSDRTVERLKFSMGETIMSITDDPADGIRYDHEDFVVINQEGVKSHKEKSYEISLEIPTTPVVPNFTGCKLFSQRYWIDVIAVLHRNFKTIVQTWVLIGQSNPNVEEDTGNEAPRDLRSLVRSSRSPARVPSSSSRQRQSGVGIGQPIRSPGQTATTSLPSHGPASSTSEVHPPVAGSELSPPDVPTDNPPSYDDVMGTDFRWEVTGAPQSSRDAERRRRVAIAESVRDETPSAPRRSSVVEPRVSPSIRGVSGSASYPSARAPVSSDCQAPAITISVPSVVPYPPANLPASSVGCTSMPMPPLRVSSTHNPPGSSAGSYTPMPMPLVQVSFTQNLPASYAGSYTPMPMPPVQVSSTQNPPASSARSFTPMPMPPPQVSSATYSPMPFLRTTPYSPGPPSSFANTAPYPPAPPLISSNHHPTPFPSASPYPSTRWGLVRAAMPDMLATHRVTSSTLYPPEEPPPLRINPMPMPIPMSNLTMHPPSSGQDNVSHPAPYPTEQPLQVCGAIGFAVLENTSNSRPSSLHSTTSNEERDSNAQR